jgi:DNA helicase IV
LKLRSTDQKVSLRRFIELADLLEQAFTGLKPLPDYLAHEGELAEQALSRATAKAGSTGDPKLAELFALTRRG